MRVVKLRIQKREPAFDQASGQVDQCDLRRIRRPREHAFAKEGTANSDAIQSADQLARLIPAFDGVGVTFAIEGAVQVQDRRVDPGRLPALSTFGTHLHDPGESSVSRDAVRFLSDPALQAFWNMEAIQRKNAAHVRIHEEQIRIIARIPHGEHTSPVTGEQVIGAKPSRHETYMVIPLGSCLSDAAPR